MLASLCLRALLRTLTSLPDDTRLELLTAGTRFRAGPDITSGGHPARRSDSGSLPLSPTLALGAS